MDDYPKEYREYAEKCIEKIGNAIRDEDFDAYQECFDPEDPGDFTKDEFENSISTEADELGFITGYDYLGSIKGDPVEFTGAVKFVYKGTFSEGGEAFIIVGVHEREGGYFLNEHVYYY